MFKSDVEAMTKRELLEEYWLLLTWRMNLIVMRVNQRTHEYDRQITIIEDDMDEIIQELKRCS